MKAKKLFPDISFRRLVRAAVPVDSLESTDVDRPLSANMGREVKEQIDESNKKTTFNLESTLADTITVVKCGNEITLTVEDLHDLVAKTSNTICTLPQNLFPYHKISHDAISTNLSEFYRFTVSLNGDVRCYPYQGVDQQSMVIAVIKFTCA